MQGWKLEGVEQLEMGILLRGFVGMPALTVSGDTCNAKLAWEARFRETGDDSKSCNANRGGIKSKIITWSCRYLP